MRIGVNCGHTVSGTKGCGAVGYIDESMETRRVGIKVERLLSAEGHNVYDCTDDYSSSVNENLKKIVSMANKQPLDLFVSIHFNSGGGRGTEVFTYGGEKHAEAVNICNALSALGFKNRGVKDGGNLYVVRHTNVKAILVEVCFVDTDDAELYKKIGADKVAQAICEAITGQGVNNEEEIDMEELKKLAERVELIEKAIGGTMIYGCIDKNMPEWAHKAAQWCIDKGIISGVSDDNLNLNEDKLWMCCVIYRFAQLIDKKINMKI